jgi:lipopolysaccharide export system protein LptC
LVTGLKVVLPLLALCILATLFLLSDPPDPERALPYAEVDVAQLARDLRVTRPRLAGLTDDGREVTLLADAAVPDFETIGKIDVVAVEGRIALSENGVLDLDAGEGRIDMRDRMADLSGGVEAWTEAGYRMTSATAMLDLGDLHLSVPGEVHIDGPGLSLTAGAMEIAGDSLGAVVSFTGGVRLLYEPES